MRTRRIVTVLAALALALTLAAGVAAADPTTPPGPSPTPYRTCAERYPVDGPGGVDLQLGCVISEIVHGYTSLGPSQDPERMTTWLIRLGAFLGGCLLLLVAVRGLYRRLNREMAPVAPASWWSCPRCHSLNEDIVERCYACGEPWTPAALTLDTPVSAPRAPGEGRDGSAGPRAG